MLGVCKNLFSIGQTLDNGLSFFSVKDRCELCSNEGRVLIVLGVHGKGWLYKLNIIVVKLES